MSFWEANRRLLILTGAALLAAIIVHFVAAAPRASDAAALEQGNRRMLLEIERLGKAGKDRKLTTEAVKLLEGQRSELAGVLKGLEGVLLVIPEGSRYLVPRGEIDPRLYFQKKLDELRKERTEGRLYPADAPLGFTKELQDREKPELLLRRMAAADRLAGAVAEAGLQRVTSIRHGPLRTRSADGVDDIYLAMLPMEISAVTDERGLVAFLTAISRQDRFLALDDLQIQVGDPKSRTFTLSATVSAITVRKGTRKTQKRPVGPTTLPVGRY